ncbi:universal stress protein [Inhella gelatinilytica]|uniref:Universal stress protein n=1 Tax=Inhella gelatinilytica TaxID=2795030 RepID=A0A931IZY6_9BURK|nr:universal stress protein [Inhella gelatinilytica]MBH9554115.1 universal stress protein [Inhella gelatinilytica]
MPALRQVLVHFFDADRSRDTLRWGAELARRQGAALQVCLAIDSVAGGAYLSPETAAMATQLGVEQMQALRAAVTGQLSQFAADLPTSVLTSTMDPLGHLVTASHGADLLVIRQPESEAGLGAGLTARLLVSALCPVLVLPHVGAPVQIGDSILVAWSHQRESGRALRDALPLLRGARTVEVLSLQDGASASPGWTEMQGWLGRQGLAATCTRLPAHSEGSMTDRLRRGWEPDASVAETLLNRAADSGADLIVCGAYGHSRAWELVLGGVTQTLLRSMTVPVLFSH